VLVTAASVQDRDGARPLLAAACGRVRLVWADGGHAGKLLDWARDVFQITVQVVQRSDDVVGVLRRWGGSDDSEPEHDRPPILPPNALRSALWALQAGLSGTSKNPYEAASYGFER
jgi:hypothetical protein